MVAVAVEVAKHENALTAGVGILGTGLPTLLVVVVVGGRGGVNVPLKQGELLVVLGDVDD